MRNEETDWWWVVALGAVALSGCEGQPKQPSGTATPVAHGSTSSRPRASAAPDERTVLRKICDAGPCGGEFASIEIWHDKSGAVGRLVFDGDVGSCSHPPRIYYDGAGNKTLTVPMQPVTKETAPKFEAMRDGQLGGLSKVREVRCGMLEGSCRANTIVREGLDDKSCAAAIRAVKALSATCTSDADCQIQAAAGGCLGVGVSVAGATQLKPLPRSCGGDCWSSSFDDHRIACRNGCCSIYEE